MEEFTEYIETLDRPTKVVISSPEQLENYLTKLSVGASSSVATALKAQMEVVKLVKTGKLITTPIDSMLQMLIDSKKEAKSEKEKEMLERQFATMIQNYICFFDAGLQYQLSQQSAEKWNLYSSAVDTLKDSVVNLAQLTAAVASGGLAEGVEVVKNIAEITFDNFLIDDKNGNEKQASFLKKVFSWFKNEEELNKKAYEFYHSLYMTFQKFSRYQNYLGKDLRIAGMIENYADTVAENEVSLEKKPLISQINNLTSTKRHKIGCALKAFLVYYYFSCVGIFFLVFPIALGFSSKEEIEKEKVSIIVCLIVLVLLLLLPFGILQFLKWRKDKNIKILNKNLAVIDEKKEKIKEEILGYSKLFDIV